MPDLFALKSLPHLRDSCALSRIYCLPVSYPGFFQMFHYDIFILNVKYHSQFTNQLLLLDRKR